MCFGKKKTVVNNPSQVKTTTVVTQPGTTVVTTQNTTTANIIPVNSVVAPVGVPAYSQQNIGKSKLVDKSLQKSTVRVQEVPDPKIATFFKDARTQRIQLQKVTNEHSSYVRHSDYFDLSSGHQAQLNNLRGLTSVSAANYAVSDSSAATTPLLQKFVYDRDIVDINYVPKTSAYQQNYVNRPPVMTNSNIIRTSNVTPSMAAGYSSNVQPYNNTYTTNYNTGVVPIVPIPVSNYNSTVQPYNQPNLAYTTNQQQPSVVYTANQPSSLYTSNQPIGTTTYTPVNVGGTNAPVYGTNSYVSQTGKTQVKYFDRDGDGVYETKQQRIDRDGDGKFESKNVYIDTDRDGKYDTKKVLIDRDGDGRADVQEVYVDRDRNGTFETRQQQTAFNSVI